MMPDGEDAYASSDDDLCSAATPLTTTTPHPMAPPSGFDGGSLSGNRSVAVDAFNFNTPHAQTGR